MAYNIDENINNADWLRGWNLPPYKSDAFYREISKQGMALEEFKKTQIYNRAVAQGLIKNDEWQGEEELFS